MVTPTQVRAVVAWARDSYRLSERRACQAVGANRSSVRYRSVRQSRDALRGRLRELAVVFVRRVLRDVTGQLSDFDFLFELALEATEQDFALTGFETINDRRNRSNIVCH